VKIDHQTHFSAPRLTCGRDRNTRHAPPRKADNGFFDIALSRHTRFAHSRFGVCTRGRIFKV